MTRPLAPADIERFRAVLAALSGFDLQQQKTEHLQQLLANRIRQTHSAGIDPYLLRFTSATTSAEEMRELAEELTVNETYFFREPAHLDAFIAHAVPGLVGAPGEASSRALRVLSAGSSSGEEAYTLAMLLKEHRPDLVERGSSVVGIDLTPGVLSKARRGRYTDWSLRQTPDAYQRRYFRKQGSEHQLDSSVRSLVTFQQRNLLEDDAAFWRPGAFDVIFCRNVFIYFSAEAVAAVVARFHRALTPGGFLFLSSAETLRGVTDEFGLVSARDSFFYRAGATAQPTSSIDSAEPEVNDSWIEAIRASSERLHALSSPPQHDAVRLPDVPAWDFNATLALFRRECFDEALANFPTHGELPARARMLRAVILTNRSQTDASERLCRDLLARNELNAEAHYLIGYGREQAVDIPAAALHYRAALQADASFAMPRFHLGALARRAGDLVQARQEFQRAHSSMAMESDERIALFAGGFTRSGLQQLCLTELYACGGQL